MRKKRKVIWVCFDGEMVVTIDECTSDWDMDSLVTVLG
jgi:hypothetical protein